MDATPGKSGRHPELLGREDTLLLVVDLQQRLMPAIADGPRVIDNVCRLVAGARVLGLPVIATEQYPRGLGSTVPAVAELLEESPRAEKLSFSCLGDTAPREQIAAAGNAPCWSAGPRPMSACCRLCSMPWPPATGCRWPPMRSAAATLPTGRPPCEGWSGPGRC